MDEGSLTFCSFSHVHAICTCFFLLEWPNASIIASHKRQHLV